MVVKFVLFMVSCFYWWFVVNFFEVKGKCFCEILFYVVMLNDNNGEKNFYFIFYVSFKIMKNIMVEKGYLNFVWLKNKLRF